MKSKQTTIIKIILTIVAALSIYTFGVSLAHADVLSSGPISTCGELAAPGKYTLTRSITIAATSTCFLVSSDSVIIDGAGFTVTYSGSQPSIGVDARSYDPFDPTALVEGGDGHTDLTIYNVTFTGFTVGVNASGNTDNSGTGVNNGYAGSGGDVTIGDTVGGAAKVGSVISIGGNSDFPYGGLGGNVSVVSPGDLDISNSTFNLIGGSGGDGVQSSGGLTLTYSGTLLKDNVSLSSLSYWYINGVNSGAYPGGTWPISPGTVTSCGTLRGPGVFTLADDIGSTTPITSTCFYIASNNITIEGAGHTVYSAFADETRYVVSTNGLTFSGLTIQNLNFDFSASVSLTTIYSKGDVTFSSADLNLFGTTINVGALTLNYVNSLNINSVSLYSALSNLTINGKNYGSHRDGFLLGWITGSGSNGDNVFTTMKYSADGRKLYAVTGATGDAFYSFSNANSNWNTVSSPAGSGMSIDAFTSSADGTKIVLSADNGIYISTNSGATWHKNSGAPPLQTLTTLASSADGKVIVGGRGATGASIFISHDYGENWSQTNSDGASWASIVSSADGAKLVGASDDGDGIEMSFDSGLNWGIYDYGTAQHTWTSIASSADGTKMVAVSADTDDGVTYTGSIWIYSADTKLWTEVSNTKGHDWRVAASSADGTRLVVANQDYDVNGNGAGTIWHSEDSGATWAEYPDMIGLWYGLTISADGSKVAVANDSDSSTRFHSDLTIPLSVNILNPSNSSSITSWNPYISWGVASSCFYSFDNFTSSSTASCALNGSGIPNPSYGESVLSVRATAGSETVTKSSAFTYNLPVSIISPTTAYPTSWNPSVIWNADGLSGLTCTYSYDDFNTSTVANCASGGSDIVAPVDNGLHTLSVRVVDGSGHVGNAGIKFTTGWSITYPPGIYEWRAMTSSADGTELVVTSGANFGTFYSGDSGRTWRSSTINRPNYSSTNIVSLASSADGTKMVAADDSGAGLYTSSDSGATFNYVSGTPSKYWSAVASSADGVKLVATEVDGSIWVSTDSGTTWSVVSGTSGHSWAAVASSADGTKLAAGATGGSLYVSTNSGATWSVVSGTSGHNWESITASADGTKFAAVNSDDSSYVWLSNSSITTWNAVSVPLPEGAPRTWTSIASSADGTKLIATDNYNSSGYPWLSSDSGVTWTPDGDSGNTDWVAATMSADGNKMAIASYGSQVILTHTNFNSTLSVDIINPSSSNVLSSWNPYVSWGIAVSCLYSYDNFATTGKIASCANHGSDFVHPAYGSQTLYVRGTDANSNTINKQVSFTNNFLVNIVSPTTALLTKWAPSVIWDVNNAGNISSCYYSYNNFTSTSTANCANGGTDIAAPTGDGSHTLYVKAIDSNGNIGTANVTFTSGWVQITSISNGQAQNVVSSADGRVLFVKYTSLTKISHDSGLTWSYPAAGGGSIMGWDISADGKKIAYIQDNNLHYSKDSGVTWTITYIGFSGDLNMSADGTKMIISRSTTQNAYYSTDSGVTWTIVPNMQAVNTAKYGAVSADGKTFAILDEKYINDDFNGKIWVSTTTGATWTLVKTIAGNLNGLKMSKDGKVLVVDDFGASKQWLSTTTGATWVNPAGSVSAHWHTLLVSYDGSSIYAFKNGIAPLYVSTTSGVTWSTVSGTSALSFDDIASSIDGSKLFGTTNIGNLWQNINLSPTLSVNILTPVASTNVGSWNPIVSWGSATSCSYSYDNSTWHSVDCTKTGTDIPKPSSTGAATLYVKGIDAGNATVTKNVSFNYTLAVWCGTADTNWNNAANWYTATNCVTPLGVVPNNQTNAILVGSVAPVVNVVFDGVWGGAPLTIDSTGLTGGANTSGVIFSGTTINTVSITGNATFNNTAINSGVITGNAKFNDTSYNTGTVGNMVVNTTFYNSSVPTTSLLTLSGPEVLLQGAVNGFFYASDGLTKITNLYFTNGSRNLSNLTASSTFTGDATNYGSITGDPVFVYGNGSSGVNRGNITGNPLFNLNSANYGTVIGNPVFTEAYNFGTIIGNVIFNDNGGNNSTNQGAILGDATFNNIKSFGMGTIYGTSTLAGTNQTITATENGSKVSNLVKIASVRDTLYLESGSVTNISTSTILRGADASHLLSIYATTPNSYATLNIAGSIVDMDYLRLRDIHNSGPTISLVDKTVYDDGENTGFIFNVDATPGKKITQSSGGVGQDKKPVTPPVVPIIDDVQPNVGPNTSSVSISHFSSASNSINGNAYNADNTLDSSSATDNSLTLKDQISGGLKSAAKGIADATAAIQTPQGTAVTQTVSTVGIATIFSSLLASPLFASPLTIGEIFFVPLRLWGLALSALGLRRKKKPWGTVYDSVTKQPIDPAFVTLFDLNGKEVADSITDMDGRFGFFVPKGTYYIKVKKANYTFPSKKLADKSSDDVYRELYFGEKIEVAEDGAVIYKNIPMDRIGFDWNEFAKSKMPAMRLHVWYNQFVAGSGNFIFWFGFVMAFISIFVIPHIYSFTIFFLYILLMILRSFGLKPKIFGTITDHVTHQPLSFATISVVSESLHQELFTKVADEYGRYYILVPKGEYEIKVSKKNLDESYTAVYESVVSAKNGVINRSIKI